MIVSRVYRLAIICYSFLILKIHYFTTGENRELHASELIRVLANKTTIFFYS